MINFSRASLGLCLKFFLLHIAPAFGEVVPEDTVGTIKLEKQGPQTLQESDGRNTRFQRLLSELDLLDDQQNISEEMLNQTLSQALKRNIHSRSIEGLRSAERVTLGVSDLIKNSEISNLLQEYSIRSNENTRDRSPQAICFPDKHFRLFEAMASFNTRSLGQFRKDAISEDGTVDHAGAIKLARFYLGLGFGAEAKSTARFIAPSLDRNLIEAMADIIDFGRTDSRILHGQHSCAGAVSLWAFLSSSDPAGGIPANPNSLLATFSQLPEHVRVVLGPYLMERMKATRLSPEAYKVAQAIKRTRTSTPEVDFALAEFELQGDKRAESQQTLERIAKGTNEISAKALLLLLEDTQKRGMEPSLAWLEDAIQLSNTTREKEISGKLAFAALRASIILGEFAFFRKNVIEHGDKLTINQFHKINAEAISSAVESADDEEFIISEVFYSNQFPSNSASPNLRAVIASRLAELGLIARAKQYIDESSGRIDDMFLLAEILVKSNRPADAEALLDEHPNGTSSRMKTASLIAQGKFLEASNIFNLKGDKSEATKAALRGGQWDWLEKFSPLDVKKIVNNLRNRQEHTGKQGFTSMELIKNSRIIRESALNLIEITQTSPNVFD